jgi:hypothetical protein
MNHSHSHSAAADQLAWDAWRYLADELSSVERAAFEERLAADQLAREAVVEMMALSEGVFAAESHAAELSAAELSAATGAVATSQPLAASAATAGPLRSGRFGSSWLASLSWFSIGVAAALLGLVLLPQGELLFPRGTVGRDGAFHSSARQGGTPSAALVVAWTEQSLAAAASDSHMESLAADAAPFSADAVGAALLANLAVTESMEADDWAGPQSLSASAVSPNHAPSWMLEAVRFQASSDETERTGTAATGTDEMES